MANSADEPALNVSAEEHIHPALQKLARAFIALTRLRQTGGKIDRFEQRPDQDAPRTPEATDGGA
jgi:hypothetical protein